MADKWRINVYEESLFRPYSSLFPAIHVTIIREPHNHVSFRQSIGRRKNRSTLANVTHLIGASVGRLGEGFAVFAFSHTKNRSTGSKISSSALGPSQTRTNSSLAARRFCPANDFWLNDGSESRKNPKSSRTFTSHHARADGNSLGRRMLGSVSPKFGALSFDVADKRNLTTRPSSFSTSPFWRTGKTYVGRLRIFSPNGSHQQPSCPNPWQCECGDWHSKPYDCGALFLSWRE